MLEINNKNISIRTQCKLLGINRSSVYYNSLINNESELANLIQEIYLSSDCRYGYRKITKDLHTRYNLKTNHKKFLKIMQEIGIQGIYPRKYTKTTIKDNNAVYPYLLKDLKISKPNEVWATDITYIRMPSRFMYFIAIIDLYSRSIIAYELSSSLEATFCINHNYYSVPFAYVGKEVEIEIGNNLVKIYHNQSLITTHSESKSKGEFITNKSHYPRYKCISNTEFQEKYQAKMSNIGEHAEQLFFSILENKNNSWIRPIQGILSLTKKYPSEIINLSCQRALAFNAYEYQIVKNICKNGSYNLPLEFN